MSADHARALGRAVGFRAAFEQLGGTEDPRTLFWTRLGASERLRDLTVTHLRGRSSGDAPMLRLGLLRDQLAEALTNHLALAASAGLRRPGDAAALAELHREVTRTDRLLLRCLGAVGYLAGGPGEDVACGELIAGRIRVQDAPVRPAPGNAGGARRSTDLPDDGRPRLRTLAREWGRELASLGAALDQDPDSEAALAALIRMDGPTFLATAGTPERFGGMVLRADGRTVDGNDAIDRVVILEELARGDVGAMMAAPGPSMSGVLVRQLADTDQADRYFERVVAEPLWTCFALTEPGTGSDAGALTTRVDPDGADRVLTGHKKFVGNAVRASLAVVFARRAPGPLGIGAYLVDTRTPGWDATGLATLGLRAAGLGEIRLDRLGVSPDDELGRLRKPSRRGLRGAIAVFDRLRPGVAAMAIGVAGAALDVCDEAWPGAPDAVTEQLDRWRHARDVVREMALDAARHVEATGDGHRGSIAKAAACRLAEDVTLGVADLLGPGAREEFAVLDRAIRAARGLEFMEGTRNIQRLNGFRGLDTGRF